MGIEISGVEQRFDTMDGGTVHALSGINLSVASGSFVALLGPSGCGKSTLLKVIAGLLAQTGGSVLVNGKPVAESRYDVGMVFQDARLLPWKTVLENVMIPIRVQRRKRADYIDRARALLDVAGIADFASRYPAELSGGMQQRVAICRALVHDPSTILMDEPFGALDAMTRETMNLELLRIWSGSQKTVVFVTHSIPEAVFLADRVVVMTPRPGKVQEIVEVDLPRPRDLGIMADPGFGRLTGHLRGLFNARGDIH